MKKAVLPVLAIGFVLSILFLFSTKITAQSTASYGMLVTSLTTALGTAVNGTSFAVPQRNSSIITWSVVGDGSASSVNLEGSMDNVTWAVLQSNVVATGGINNYGPTNVKFVRISQVSRTVGTITTGTLITNSN